MPEGADQAAAHEGAQLASRQEPDKQTDSLAPIPLVDDQGRPVLGSDGKPIFRPSDPRFDPQVFVQRGLKDRRLESEASAIGRAPGGLAALLYELWELSKFRQQGSWDIQRVGGKYRSEFRDYATVVIGLYAAAAGIPKWEILKFQDTYAWLLSKFNEPPDPGFLRLPARNVEDTNIGYSLFESGAIKAKPER